MQGVIFILLATAFFALAVVFSRRPSGMAVRNRKLASILFAIAGGLSLLAGLLYLLNTP